MINRTNTPEKKLRHALQSLLATNRFFGVLALGMPMQAGPVKTIAGDGQTFAFNPDWVGEATHDEIKGCMVHIVSACALKHQLRRGERDYDKWQKASRLATAPLLEKEDVWLPPEVEQMMRQVKGLDDLPIETIYERLIDDDDKDDQDEQGDGQGQGGAAAAGAGGDQDQDSDDDQDGDGEGQGQPQAGQGQGDGDPSQGQAPRAPGEVLDAPQEQKDDQDRKWDRAAKQALQVSKSTGSDPGDIAQEFDGQHEHRRDWQDILREYMRAVAPTDYTWSKPNRRHIDTGLYLPSLSGEGMGPVVVAIDTSGSVDDDHVNRACAEIFEIARDVGPERIHVIQCDTRVTDWIDFDPLEAPETIEIKGRGGTAFQPVFDWVEEHGIDPDVMIYMTDLGGPLPNEPSYPIIWAVETEQQLASAPFGDGIVIPE